MVNLLQIHLALISSVDLGSSPRLRGPSISLLPLSCYPHVTNEFHPYKMYQNKFEPFIKTCVTKVLNHNCGRIAILNTIEKCGQKVRSNNA